MTGKEHCCKVTQRETHIKCKVHSLVQWVCDVSITGKWSRGTGPTGLGTCTDRSHVRMKRGMSIWSTAEKTKLKFYKQL